MRALWFKLRTWIAGPRLERELREELAFHRDMLERDLAHDGIEWADAATLARRRLGNVTYLQEETRMHWGFPTLESLFNDARYALRSLRANPSYTIAAVLTLALGVGSTVAIFSIVDAVLLRPLPYRDGSELVSIYSTGRNEEGRLPLSYLDFRDLRAHVREGRTLASVAYARGDAVRVRGEFGAEGVLVAFVTEGLFPLMGTPPLLGRTFAADDERPGAERILVLGHRVWIERFGGDPDIINRQVSTVNGPYTVIGVMPPTFAWPEWAQAWAPIHTGPFTDGSLNRRSFRVDARTIGRLAPGVTSRQANGMLAGFGNRLAKQYPAEDGELTMRAATLRNEIVGPVRRPLLVLLGAVAGLLLIACSNVSNLALARASTRVREIGVRLAIGASRARIARQLVVESTVLALIGGAVGIVVAYGAVRALVRFAPPDIPRLTEVAIDERVLVFALGVCVLSVLLFGFAPALSVSAANLARAIREGGRGGAGSRSALGLQSAFVIGEVAIAAVLVIGSGLLVKSFSRLSDAHPGFEPDRLISLRIEPLADKYPSPEQKLLLYNTIRDAVTRIPGVERVSYINHSPATRSGVYTPLESDGDPRPGGQPPGAAYRLVDAGYFETMGQRVLRGRPFTASEMTQHGRVAVVNEMLARSLWGTSDPIGRKVVAFKQSSGADAGARIEARVIGVVEDIKDYDLSGDSWTEVYLPFPVNPWRSMFIAVRTKTDPRSIIPVVQRTVSSIDPDLPVRRTEAVDRMLRDRLARRSFNAAIVTGFGVVALLLASFGIYGIVAYGVAQRTQEIGIRAALGASAGQLIRTFLSRATALAVAGVVIGIGLAALLGQTLESLLFGVDPIDLTTFIQVAGAMIAVAVLASFIPARRALRVDPLIAMRSD